MAWMIDIIKKDGERYACTDPISKKDVMEVLPHLLKFACFGNGEFELHIKPVENG